MAEPKENGIRQLGAVHWTRQLPQTDFREGEQISTGRDLTTPTTYKESGPARSN